MRFRLLVLVAMMVMVVVPARSQRRRAVRIPGAAWTSQLAVNTIDVTTIAGTPIRASSRLSVTWQPPATAVDHYVITATDAAGGAGLTFSMKT